MNCIGLLVGSILGSMTQDLLKDRSFQFLNTLNEKEIIMFVTEEIKLENPECQTLIKYASILGADLQTLLCVGIRNNNLQCVCACIKYGCDINYQDEDGDTYLHISTKENNHITLKYFISKGLDVNKENNQGIRPSEIALALDHFKCYKLLIENGAMTYYIADNGKKVHDFEITMESYQPDMDPMIISLIERTDPMIKLDESMFNTIKHCIMMKQSIVEKILLRFPNFVNTTINRITLLLLLIETKEFELVNKILKLKTTNLNPSGLFVPYLSNCLSHGTMDEKNHENIKFLIEKAPKLINKKCKDGRTAIDYVLLGFTKYTLEGCKDMLELLMDKTGKEILNNRNEMDFRTLETAIQFTDHNIINFLIDNGININEEMIEEYCFKSQIQNNDPLSFACQVNKPLIINVLLTRGVTINLHDKIPICLLTAIAHDLSEPIDVLMADKRIKKICENKKVKKKLIDFCLNNTSNKDIMKYFIDDDKLATLQINQETVIYNKIERYFESVIDEYQESKELIMYILYVVVSYYKFITSKTIKYTMYDVISKYFDTTFLMGKKRNLFEVCIMSICLNYECPNNFFRCNDNIDAIINTDDPKMCDYFWKEFLNTIDGYHKLNDKLTNTLNILKAKKNTKYLSDEISEYSLHSENDSNYILRVLEPLEKPQKVPHYDCMYQRLSGLNCVISETSEYIVAHDNTSKITSIIFNDGSYVPKRWFKHYQHNIGKENKDDFLHLFPFILDKKLKGVNCYQKSVPDDVNQYGTVLLISFLGMLINDSEYILGVYEYFIDASGLLFHRFFKPHDQISDKMKHHLSISTKQQINEKHRLAKELIKNF